MKQFIVHDAAGSILRTGSCSDDDLVLQAGNGEVVVEGVADDATQRFSGGVLVTKPEPTDVEKSASSMIELKVLRQSLLADSDWTQTTDSPLTAEQRSEWQMYRQALRDLPADYSYVTSLEQVTFPTAPS
jgi:hypothetical protein